MAGIAFAFAFLGTIFGIGGILPWLLLDSSGYRGMVDRGLVRGNALMLLGLHFWAAALFCQQAGS